MASYHSSFFILFSLLLISCSPQNKYQTNDGRTIVSFWVKWEGFEREALESVISKYNESQSDVFVKTLSVSDPKRKVMLATANGHPPDLAFLFYFVIPSYAENNALTPLDSLFKEHGISKDAFLPGCQEAISHRGFTWAIPTTSTATALHYNKALLDSSGVSMDPPPSSLEELEALNEKLVSYRKNGGIERIGFLPIEPDWWLSEWGFWFGGKTIEDDQMQLEHSAWSNSMDWFVSYPERFGQENLMRFKSGFGRFATSQNPFFTGKVAMVHQGMWMENFVQNYAPENFEYGIAPMPSSNDSGIPFVSIVEPDVICIPKGAKHIPEAMDFIKFLLKQENLEQLALEQRKLTSLTDVSDDFIQEHSHPFIEEFQAFAASPHAQARPKLINYEQYQSDMRSAYEATIFGRSEPAEALSSAIESQKAVLQKGVRRWNRVKESRVQEWSEN